MFCPNCNSYVDDSASVCPNCGTRFAARQSQYQQPQYQQQNAQYQQPQYQQQYQQPQYRQAQYQQPYQQPQYQQDAQYRSAPYQQQYQQQYQQPQYQQQYQQPQYQQPQYQQPGPVAQLRTDRSLLKTILLSIVTCGIYALICYGNLTDDVNTVCSRYDGKKSMNYYLLVFIVAPFTLGIAAIVWMHNLCNRVGSELQRRQIDYKFSASDFWLWGVLGTFIIVGPFVFGHKLFKAVNLMNENFNQYG